MTATTDLPGFADPVLDSQACFRAVMEAMSRPGRIERVPRLPEIPPGLSPASAALLLTMVDRDSPLCLAAGDPARDWVRFHSGARLVAATEANFVLDADTGLLDLPAGTEEEPERGATLVVEVTALGTGRALLLAGPGILGTCRLLVEGLPPALLRDWPANRARFPRGVDVILCAGDRIAALPRGVAIEEG